MASEAVAIGGPPRLRRSFVLLVGFGLLVGAMACWAVTSAVFTATTSNSGNHFRSAVWNAGQYGDAVRADTPEAYYPLNEPYGPTARDFSGKGNDATYAGTVLYGRPGALPSSPDTAAGFDGHDGHVQLPDSFDPTNGYTLETWANPAGAGTYARFIELGNGPDTNNLILSRLGTTNGVILQVHANGNVTSVFADNVLTDGQWTYLAVSWDPATGTGTLYVNGKQVATAPLDAPTAGPRTANYLARSDYSDPYFQGDLAQAAIYDHPITADRIQAHYDAAFPAPDAPTALQTQPHDAALALTWTAPTGSVPVRGYHVHLDGPGGDDHDYTTTDTSYVTRGLTNGSAYTASVTATNSATISATSNAATATPAVPSGAYATAVRTDNPTSWYRLGELPRQDHAVDDSGHAHDATFTGGVTHGTTGATGDTDTATTFNGTDGQANLPDALDPTNGFSIEAWVDPSAVTTWARIAELSNGPNTNNILLSRSYDDPDTLVLGIHHGGDAQNFFVPGVLGVGGGWRHIVATWTPDGSGGGTATVYLNGTQIAQQAMWAPLPGPYAQSYLAHSAYPGDQNWQGGLDDVALYDHALSATRVDVHYAAGTHTTAAAAPAGVHAQSHDAALAVDWTTPAQGTVDHYHLVATPTGGGTPVTLDTTGAPTSAILRGLSNGTAYAVTVAAVDPGGGTGPPSVAVTATPVVPTGPYATAVRADSPTAYYRLDELSGQNNTVDDSDVAQDGAFSGGVTHQATGTTGDGDQATSFDGVDGYASIPRSISDDFAIEFWFHAPAQNGNDDYNWYSGRGLVDGEVGGVQNDLGVSLNGAGRVVAGTGGGSTGGDTSIRSGTGLDDDQWHHVVFDRTQATGTLQLYVDDSLVDSYSGANTASLTTPDQLTIGEIQTNINRFNGTIDDVALYNHTLSASRVDAHYSATISAPATPGTVTAQPHDGALALSWPASAQANRYHVTVSPGGTNGDTAGVTPSYVARGLTSGTAYTVTVTAVNGAGTSAGSTATGTPAAPTGAYAPAVRTDSPFSYYRLGEVAGQRYAVDDSGNSRDATFTGGVTHGTAGTTGDANTATTFDGNTGRVALPNTFDPSAGYAIEGWIRPTAATKNARVVELSNGPDTNNIILQRGGTSDDLSLVVVHGGTNNRVDATGVLTENVWQYVAASWDPGTGLATLYVGGAQVAQGTVWAPQTGSYSQSFIGHSTYNSEPDFPGAMDDVALYTHPLSATRVAAHYGAVHGSATAPSAVQAEPHAASLLIGWTAPSSGPTPTGYRIAATPSGKSTVYKTVDASAGSTVVRGLTNATTTSVRVTTLTASGAAGTSGAVAATPAVLTGTYAAAVTTDTPFSYYRLGEAFGADAVDDSGNSHDATLVGGPTHGRPSAISTLTTNNATGFDGVDDYAQLPNVFDPSNGYAFDGWIRPTAATNGARIVELSDGPDTNNIIFQRQGTSDDLSLWVDHGSTYQHLTATDVLIENRWQHVAVSWSSGTATIYVDGQQVAQGAVWAPQAGSYSQSYLARSTYNEPNTPGDMDEIALYQHALAGTRVLAHHDAAFASNSAPTALAATPGSGSLALSWTAPAGGPTPTGYRVRLTPAGGSTQVINTGSTATSYTATGLTNGTSYTVTVAAVSGYGPAITSSSVTATPAAPAALNYPATVKADSPTVYYRMGETSGTTMINAVSPGTSDGTYVGTTTLGQPGAIPVDTAVSFGGSGAAQTANPYTGTFSVEFWFASTAGSGASTAWFADASLVSATADSATSAGWGVGLSSTGAITAGTGGSPQRTIASSGGNNDGQWHHVVFTRDASGPMALYVDGAQAASGTGNTGTLGASSVLAFGCRAAAGSCSSTTLTGSVDEGALYNGIVLPSARITAHYDARNN